MEISIALPAIRNGFRLFWPSSVFAVVISLIVVPASIASAQRIRNSTPAEQVPASQLQQTPPVQSFPEITYLRAPKQVGEAPPVHYPATTSRLGPSVGYPIVVRENGTISLPLVKPIPVRGLSLEQAEALIKSVYRGASSSGKRILTGDSRIIVTLQRERTINVIVIRQDSSDSMRARGINQSSNGAVFDRSDRSSRLSSVQLPAYEGDVFNALIETGGLPGVNAARDVRVYRSENRNASSTQFVQNGSPFPRSNSSGGAFPRSGFQQSDYATNQYHGSTSDVSIPLHRTTNDRFFDRRQAALSQGDVVVVEAKPTEVYYTGGLLRGGEHPLPRDKALTVVEAVALAGGPMTSTGGLGLSRLQPTELIVARNNGRNGQINIRVDLDRALNDPTQQILVAPGDHLFLQHSRGV